MDSSLAKKGMVMDTDWTELRIQQLDMLEELLRECESIDSGNRIIGRLQRIEELAKKLSHGNLRKAEPSFVRFLDSLAIKERTE